MRKIWTILLAMLLLVTSVQPAIAEEPEFTPDPARVHEARDLYKQCLYASGRDSFRGFCGLMTSYQLWKLGINENLEIHDGNKQYDAYKNLQFTTGGYKVRAYGADKYTLETALETITEGGKKDVQNILVGFQWTSTEAGTAFGHACVINAIQDGIVYFTESFDHAMGRREGQTISCTIASFVEFFRGWTQFEGVIYFGQRNYADLCAATPVNTYLQLRFDSNLRSQPCLMGENNCQRVRSLAAGELLKATALYENEFGDRFYLVEEAGEACYVSANAVFQLQPQTDREGWFLEEGVWHCYENGAPCTGWVTRIGVSYYLDENGAACTGWQEIAGQTYYFSPTGALCQGWFTVEEQTYYQGETGRLVTGLQSIEGVNRFFGRNGVLLNQGTVTWEGLDYTVTDGVAVPNA
ncbi:MAG: hypothetical protein IKA47_02000 [Oscillospiraceae bacterium]|nr:hypothetical protein [Oscillospiraceae bacterium]